MTRTWTLLLVPLLLVGCHKVGPGDPDSATSHADDDFDVTVTTVEDIPTVIVVDWSADLVGVTSAWVEFGTDTDYGRTAPTDLSTGAPYRTFILGSKPDTTVHLRVVAQTADTLHTSEDRTITTGPAPAALPNLTVESSGDHWQGWLVTGLVSDPTSLIIDQDGAYVWWHPIETSRAAGAGEVVLRRTAMARDGQSILYNYNDVEGDVDNAIYRVGLDGTDLGETATPYGHHDFVELPDGTITYLAYDPKTVGRDQVLGDSVIEKAPDGTITEIYNVWNHYTYGGSSSDPTESWPHANAIDYLEDEDAYIVGFLTLYTVLKIDRATGHTLWTLGGTQSDFTLDGGTTDLFDTEHQFEWLGDSLLVFINGGMEAGAESHAIEYKLDDTRHTVTETWSYHPAQTLNCPNLGDVDRLDNGNTLVTFSVAGEIHEVDTHGDPVWTLSSGVGGALSYTLLLEDINARTY